MSYFIKCISKIYLDLLHSFQRVNQCLKNACSDSEKSSCFSFIDCGSRHSNEKFYSSSDLSDWQTNPNATACFSKDGPFQYGIYVQAVNLITENSVVTRYLYSLFWGFQVFLLCSASYVEPMFLYAKVNFNQWGLKVKF